MMDGRLIGGAIGLLFAGGLSLYGIMEARRYAAEPWYKWIGALWPIPALVALLAGRDDVAGVVVIAGLMGTAASKAWRSRHVHDDRVV